MSIPSFLKLVEIQTKVASVIPFLLGTAYTLYRFNSFDLKNFILMFISLIAFDMAVTATNNFYDYKNAKKTYGYNYEIHNVIVRSNLKEKTVLGVIFTLVLVAVICGFILFLNTNVFVLILGGISFVVGLTYSAGPIPISRTPLGETFSGIFMGFVIVFISVYIHIYDENIVKLIYNNGILDISIDIIEIIYIFLISLPAVNGIANIMLANNICDIEDDIENRRYTLPIHIGKENALKLFKVLYYAIYIDLIILVIIKILPIYSLFVLLTIMPVINNIQEFNKKQTKKDTFVLAVKNFVIINIVHVISLGIGAFS
ncbi:1,4-dihydroxy-2-naphthoate polyprenyltransferase [Maledivibacter halophilus]|uniref:1,4-dihydroxy-2-naphthoate octaprenyltransferase n=1 Tax=Maledivibacter halophilus TaxID=36842 RepID=A0A1T5LTU1_9FIRM|nr:1,4-dihydroxy-2-naphthoate polyprenyltransferase [Maledivibacter halophilus]SKC79301.1 1,4-dihydroxy-2-naphthoate octaprenyltransferase [Maledivibacter halophilus]